MCRNIVLKTGAVIRLGKFCGIKCMSVRLSIYHDFYTVMLRLIKSSQVKRSGIIFFNQEMYGFPDIWQLGKDYGPCLRHSGTRQWQPEQ